jgi:hypothetical protein
VNRQEVEAYLASKMQADPEADERDRQMRLMAGLGRAGSTIGAAIGGIKADTSYYDQLEADATKGTTEREKRRMEVAQALQKKFESQDAAVAAARKDALDRETRLGEKAAERETRLQDKADQRKWQEEQNRLSRENTRVLAESASADRAERRTESNQLAKEKALNTDVEQLGKRFAPLSSMFNSVAEIESRLGFNVDDATVDDSGNLIAGGKYQDLPGVNLPFVGRTQFYDQNARELGSSLANLYNTILKDRSGAAVTENELRRLELETGGGKFDTEANMIRGLQAIKSALRNSAGAARSSFSPEAVSEYERRGSRLDAIDPVIAKKPGEKHADGDSGTAIATPAAPSVDDMDDSEVERQLKARGLL